MIIAHQPKDTASTANEQYRYLNVLLDVERGELRGPRGTYLLQPQLLAVAQRLFRRAGNLVSRDALISACWPDPDNEPESVDASLRVRVSQLRRALILISAATVGIRTEPSVGCALEAVR